MGVKLRVKKYTSGTQTYYLDINTNNQRTFEFLDIKVDKNTSSDDKKQKRQLAENTAAKRQLEIEHNQHGFIPKHRKKVIFNDYYQAFLDSYKKNDTRIYKYAFVKFCEHTENKRIAASHINERLIEGYRDYLESKESGLHGETPHDYFSRFRRVLKRAYNDGLIAADTFLKISNISIKKNDTFLKKQILTIEELRILKGTKCGNEEVKRAFLFACFTGLGEAEIRKITWRKILK